MNYQRNRVPHLAVLSLMLIGIASLIAFSDWPHRVQAIKLLRDNALVRGAETLLAHPAPNQSLGLVNGASNTTVLPIATDLSNAHAFLALQQGCKCADVVLVIDDTQSMTSAINGNLKPGINAIVPAARNASGNDLRMGVVTFKDTIEVDQPFTTVDADIISAVNAITPSGGGGLSEASDEALKYVVTGASACPVAQLKGAPLGSFRPQCFKIAIVVTDAAPGGCDSTYADGVDDANAIAVANLAKGSIIISSVLVQGMTMTSVAHPLGVQDFVMSMYASITGGKF